MKLQEFVLALLIPAIAASPVLIEDRQATSTSDDLKNGICRKVTFIYARGSTEAGNMGKIIGPQTCAALRVVLGAGNVACQGVGSPYSASLFHNVLSQNTSPAAIGAATTMFNLANTQCPTTLIVAGGYSQGTAVMDGFIQALPASLMAKVKGVVLFGYTRNKQDGGRIPKYPTSQTKIYCATGDLVCNGTLAITSAHFTYGANISDAAAFLADQIGL